MNEIFPIDIIDNRMRWQAGEPMTEQPMPSLRKLLADLHAYRLKTMAPADLQVNIDQRALLERTAGSFGRIEKERSCAR